MHHDSVFGRVAPVAIGRWLTEVCRARFIKLSVGGVPFFVPRLLDYTYQVTVDVCFRQG